MIELVVVCMAFLLVIIVITVEMTRSHKTQIDRLMVENHAERIVWREERQQLLDRIQAGSFGEYKQAEIKLAKAQTGEKEPPKLEQL